MDAETYGAIRREVLKQRPSLDLLLWGAAQSEALWMMKHGRIAQKGVNSYTNRRHEEIEPIAVEAFATRDLATGVDIVCLLYPDWHDNEMYANANGLVHCVKNELITQAEALFIVEARPEKEEFLWLSGMGPRPRRPRRAFFGRKHHAET